jgi:hypothetical protein
MFNLQHAEPFRLILYWNQFSLRCDRSRACARILKHRDKRAETTKQQRELEAESVAFAVMAHFGMRVESRFYLATYDVTGEMLTASLATINAAARQLIEGIGEPTPDTELQEAVASAAA